jgi:DNA polymerase alpha-associated DNA helicase A
MERTLRHVRRIVAPETTSGPTYAVPNLTLINTLLGIEESQWHDEVPAPFPSEGQKAEGGVDNEIKWFGEALNDSQKEAISFCLKAQTVACIHGPPGVSLIYEREEVLILDWKNTYPHRTYFPAPLETCFWTTYSTTPYLDHHPFELGSG